MSIYDHVRDEILDGFNDWIMGDGDGPTGIVDALESHTPYGPEKSQAQITMTVRFAGPQPVMPGYLCDWLADQVAALPQQPAYYDPDTVPSVRDQEPVRWADIVRQYQEWLTQPPVEPTPWLPVPWERVPFSWSPGFDQNRRELINELVAEAVDRARDAMLADRFARAATNAPTDANMLNPFITIDTRA